MKRQVNVPLIAIVGEGLLSRLSFGLISFALPLYARHLGFSLSQVGILVALNSAVGPAKSEDRKGGEGKTDANLTILF